MFSRSSCALHNCFTWLVLQVKKADIQVRVPNQPGAFRALDNPWTDITKIPVGMNRVVRIPPRGNAF